MEHLAREPLREHTHHKHPPSLDHCLERESVYLQSRFCNQDLLPIFITNIYNPDLESTSTIQIFTMVSLLAPVSDRHCNNQVQISTFLTFNVPSLRKQHKTRRNTAFFALPTPATSYCLTCRTYLTLTEQRSCRWNHFRGPRQCEAVNFRKAKCEVDS